MKKSFLIFTMAVCYMSTAPVSAQVNPAILHLYNYSYFYGRQYYVLRSGRAQMFVQADKVDLGPSFTYLLFDAENASQSWRKANACNYTSTFGFTTSGLQVVMGGFPFTAVGQNLETKWVYEDGIPKVEAVWWAGGIRVTEKLFALAGANAFERTITLDAAKIVGPETVVARLGIPGGKDERVGNSLIYSGPKGRIAVAVPRTVAAVKVDSNYLEFTGIHLTPGARKQFATFVVAQIPESGMQAMISRIDSATSTNSFSPATREKWETLSAVSTSDSTIENLYNNARFTLPGYVSDVGILDAGVFEYGGQWIRDGSNTTLGLLRIGDFELAHALLKHMLDSMITESGATMIGSSFDRPEYEELDQMGELWQAMKSYYYWTGDSSLLKENAQKLIAMTRRPIQPMYLDSTGMVHDKREYWERSLSDAYELAYQVFVIQGLRDAVELAPIIGAEKYVPRWKEVADKMLHAMLHDPKMGLVSNGRLIKRRNVDGEIVDTVRYKGYIPGSPGLTESLQRLLPDASMALPISMGLVDPKSRLARNTLEELQQLWNSRWSTGGYDRYNTSSQPDQPGAWIFATEFMLNAEQEAGMYGLSRRSLDWLSSVQGGHTGAYFEEIPVIRAQEFSAGILPWCSAEIGTFVVKHWLGIRFVNGHLVIKPNLFPGSKKVAANLRFRKSRIKLVIDGEGRVKEALINGSVVKPDKDGAIVVPTDFNGGSIRIEVGVESR